MGSGNQLKKKGDVTFNTRWTAIKLLEHDEEVLERYEKKVQMPGHSYAKEISNQKYDYIEEMMDECLFYKSEKAAVTDRVDEVLTHSIWGSPYLFGNHGACIFPDLFVGDALKGVFEVGLSAFSDAVYTLLLRLHTADWLISLIVDGIIAGVGGILTFLPNIFILFLALAVLEDSGYMARVAYVMDGIMGKVGLSGKAFLPMILGFGCTVPAVMASRALEREEDRKKDNPDYPFMSCSARLPIYVLFADMFFGRYAMVAAFSMYVIGMATAIVIALIANRLGKNMSTQSLLIELPGVQVTQCPHHLHICVGEGEGLSDKGGDHDLCGLHHHLVYSELQSERHGDRCVGELWCCDRTLSGAVAGTGRAGNVADCGGLDFGVICKRGGCLQLCGSLRRWGMPTQRQGWPRSAKIWRQQDLARSMPMHL